MKRQTHCAGCDERMLLSERPPIWGKGLRTVQLLLCSGRTCAVTLCATCAKVPPELLPRIWREYTEAMAFNVEPAQDTMQRSAVLLFRQDVPLSKVYCQPWPLVPA